MSGRDANQLAADVRQVLTARAQLANILDGDVPALDELVALVGTLQQERDEALSHCRGPIPSPERIAEAHSRLPADWFEKGYARLANHGVGHFAFSAAAAATGHHSESVAPLTANVVLVESLEEIKEAIRGE